VATAEIARNVTETASAANEMTGHATEVSAEAEQTGKRATDLCKDAAALNTAEGELRHAVIRVVRNSTTEMDRRHERRFPEHLTCHSPLRVIHRPHMSPTCRSMAPISAMPSVPAGTRGTLRIDSVDFALPFSVQAVEADALHLTFELDAATAARFRLVRERLARRDAA
jgi:methyl-accepting chemotaxis protein